MTWTTMSTKRPTAHGRGPAILLAAGAALALTLAGSSDARAARVCHNKLYQGSSPPGLIAYVTQGAALNAAKQNWILQVTSDTAADWADLQKSTQRKQSCNRVPNGIGGYNHHCVFRAKPCRDQI